MSTYREEVLGKRVDVEFDNTIDNHDTPRCITRTATIEKVTMELVDGMIQATHYVAFGDDGESQWLNLDQLEMSGKLWWRTSKSSSSHNRPTRINKVSSSSFDQISSSSRKQKNEQSSVIATTSRQEDDHPDPTCITPEDSASVFNDPQQQLGKQVEIEFYVGNDMQFFLGTIQKVVFDHKDDGEVQHSYYVVFDDGDEQWFDLENLDRAGRLRWPLHVERVSNPQGTISIEPKQQLGKRVEVKFRHQNTNRHQFYTGTIQKVKMKLVNDGRIIQYRHYVVFNDGEKQWFDLMKSEKSGELRWPEAEERGLLNKRGNAAMDDTNDESTKKKPRTSQEETPHSMPASIDGVIKYMDLLEPEKNYFERQQDKRKGCSKTRQKLRKFAKSNPTHPAVRHYTQTDKWGPPNGTSLLEMMDLIKTMIR